MDEGLFVHVLNAHQKQALTLSSYDRQANDLFIAPNLQVPSGAYPFLNNSLNITYIPEAIEYFTRYVDAFKTYGVNVNGLSLMNEPLNYQGISRLPRVSYQHLY